MGQIISKRRDEVQLIILDKKFDTNLGSNQERAASCTAGCNVFGHVHLKKAKKLDLNSQNLAGKVEKFLHIIKKDTKMRQDNFETERLQKIADRRVRKVNRMAKNEIDKEALLASQNQCCEQCTLPFPLLCWRYKIRFGIEKKR